MDYYCHVILSTWPRSAMHSSMASHCQGVGLVSCLPQVQTSLTSCNAEHMALLKKDRGNCAMPRDTPISEPVPRPPEVASSALIPPTTPTAEAVPVPARLLRRSLPYPNPMPLTTDHSHSSQVHGEFPLAGKCEAQRHRCRGVSIFFLFFIY